MLINNRRKASQVISTLMAKEHVISRVISTIRYLDLHGNRQLFIHTNNGRLVRLDRLPIALPKPIIQNILIHFQSNVINIRYSLNRTTIVMSFSDL